MVLYWDTLPNDRAVGLKRTGMTATFPFNERVQLQVKLYAALWQLPGHWHATVSSMTWSCQLTDMQQRQFNVMQLSAHCMQLSPRTLSSCQHMHYWAYNASAMQLITSTTQQLTKETNVDSSALARAIYLKGVSSYCSWRPAQAKQRLVHTFRRWQLLM